VACILYAGVLLYRRVCMLVSVCVYACECVSVLVLAVIAAAAQEHGSIGVEKHRESKLKFVKFQQQQAVAVSRWLA